VKGVIPLILALSLTCCGGNVRTPAQFEPSSGVIICWPLNIPENLVRDLSENVTVYVIIQDSVAKAEAASCFERIQAHNAEFIEAPVSSPGFIWVRDCGPVFTVRKGRLCIVDPEYNCHRETDDAVPRKLSHALGIPYKKSRLVWSGGNFMTDGKGMAVSCDHILKDNGYNEKRIRRIARRELGITDFHFVPDAQSINMNHIDCWAQFLSPGKVLVARVPKYDSRYNGYEAAAEWFSKLESTDGQRFEVFRVDIPAYDTLAPYTNSLILNKCVYVPLGVSEQYDSLALQVYRDALPDYTVKGYKSVKGRYWSSGEQVFRGIEWLNTDALHCRTIGIPAVRGRDKNIRKSEYDI